jgi:hypothetical protein
LEIDDEAVCFRWNLGFLWVLRSGFGIFNVGVDRNVRRHLRSMSSAYFQHGVVIPAERDATIFFAAVIIFISLVCILGPPQIPTLIVQALGIGAYDDADVVVEKRYCESLVAEGMPLFRNPASWDEDRSRHQRDVESLSYIQVLNDDTIMLRHMRVLLRVGGQVALRRRGASEKQGFVNRSIILVPATQILQVSALYVRSPP